MNCLKCPNYWKIDIDEDKCDKCSCDETAEQKESKEDKSNGKEAWLC